MNVNKAFDKIDEWLLKICGYLTIIAIIGVFGTISFYLFREAIISTENTWRIALIIGGTICAYATIRLMVAFIFPIEEEKRGGRND